MNLIKRILKALFLLIIILLGLSSFLTKQYLQLVPVVLILSLLFMKPVRHFLSEKINNYSQRTELLIIIFLLVSYFSAGKIYLRSTIYRSAADREEIMARYDELQKDWPTGTESLFIGNQYGKIHVLIAGPDTAPPLLLFPAENMGAVSWSANFPVLASHFRCYAIDHPGEAGKSKLADLNSFPKSEQELARLYLEIADSLGLDNMALAGAGTGGRNALLRAINAPGRVSKLALIAPMGIHKPAPEFLWQRLAISMFPLPAIRQKVATWTIGTSETTAAWTDWYDAVLRGCVPHTAYPMAIAPEELAKIEAPVLLVLGTNDQHTGTPQQVTERTKPIGKLQTEILESAHLIAIEKTLETNQILLEFLSDQ
ncbi:alpha/beta fold hydrolase [Gaoshiqia sediminis]|uniref:Alpha/beta hydrolase n=1 Tax=Gaoshiqia sediminis TaxID=2986998 RepID=A0AA41YC70_9BACT|nr:alpha/beta hydrolase [Gaoshiqia sediminis]MCW0482247.1 alpha/beta hydrolase [Gaoshiqia sediminis]